MKTIAYLILLSSRLLLTADIYAQNADDFPSANIAVGNGTHGILAGADYRFKKAQSSKSGTRAYFYVGFQNIKFKEPYVVFINQKYSSDSKIVMYSAGLSQDIYLKSRIIIAPYFGIRYESTKFADSYINEKVRGGQFVRYWNNVEVGKRLSENYGSSELTFDIGGSMGLRLFSKIWLYGKVGYSPVKYQSDNSAYGPYWANTNNVNPFYINRAPIRAEALLAIGLK